MTTKHKWDCCDLRFFFPPSQVSREESSASGGVGWDFSAASQRVLFIGGAKLTSDLAHLQAPPHWNCWNCPMLEERSLGSLVCCNVGGLDVQVSQLMVPAKQRLRLLFCGDFFFRTRLHCARRLCKTDKKVLGIEWRRGKNACNAHMSAHS